MLSDYRIAQCECLFLLIDNDVIINQVGCFGLFLGQIDFFFDQNNNKTFNSSLLVI